MEENKSLENIQWIKTPFSYTKFSKNLSLLQQNILIKVSAFMQRYWDSYWNTELKNNNEQPKAFLSEVDAMNIPPIKISFSDMGIKPNHYDRIDEAINEILDIRVDVPVMTNDGLMKRRYNIFAYNDTPMTEAGTTVTTKDGNKVHVDRRLGYFNLQLNPHVVNFAFHMSQGYVSHPENIARIGKAENMPQMYYLIKHHMSNWKKSTARIELPEIKEYLGMIHRDDEGNIDNIKYPKYAQFRLKVIKRAMDEMHELYLQGKIDKDFAWTEEREGGKKTGDPKAIVFSLIQDASETNNTSENDDGTQKRSWLDAYAEKNGNPTTAIGQNAWDGLCAKIQDEQKRNIFTAVKVEKIEYKSLFLYGEKSVLDTFDACFKTELNDEMRTWVFSILTSMAKREIKTFKYHEV